MWSDKEGFVEELISSVTKDTEFGVKHLTDSVAATAEVHVYSISVITPSKSKPSFRLFVAICSPFILGVRMCSEMVAIDERCGL